jgi:hypothetical protein
MPCLDYPVRLLRSTCLWILLLPYAVSFLGAASNQLVLFVNNDRFPVAMNIAKLHKWVPEEARVESADGILMIDETHCLMTNKTHLNILADIFDFHEDIESIGDLLLNLGAWLDPRCPLVWLVVIVMKAKAALLP